MSKKLRPKQPDQRMSIEFDGEGYKTTIVFNGTSVLIEYDGVGTKMHLKDADDTVAGLMLQEFFESCSKIMAATRQLVGDLPRDPWDKSIDTEILDRFGELSF